MLKDIEMPRVRDMSNVDELIHLAGRIRRTTIAMAEGRGPTHLASALSLVEILAVLYGRSVDLALIRSQARERDRVILSKAHGAMALYSTFAEVGLIEREGLSDYGFDLLPVHPVRGAIPGVELTCGSLGNGLSAAIGMALAARLDSRQTSTFVVLGDGECQEGSTWEAAMLAPRLRTGPLTAIVDCNGLQQNSLTEIEVSPDALAQRFKQLGWRVADVDGHDVQELFDAFAQPHHGQPMVLIARTVKGKGVAAFEANPGAHYVALPFQKRDKQ